MSLRRAAKRRVSHEGMVSVGGNLYSVPDPTLDFIARYEVVHLLGPPGTSKSDLAVALGVEAVKAGKSVYFN